MYRPNFCAECGERVVRERWRAWASRRFCARCERRFGRAWVRPLAALCLAACAGFAAGRRMRPAPPPLVVERGSLPGPALLSGHAGAPKTGGAGDAAANAPDDPAAPTSAEPPTDPAEVVSICGARTKKGTPCSRRVRGTGRCWQHIGRAAIIPLQKRMLTGN